VTGPEHGSLADEARRFAEAFSDWSHDHGAGFTAAAGSSEQCRYCPVCQLIALMRGERPEAAARLVEAGTALAEAVRTLLTPPAAAPEDDPPPTVQRIDVG